LSPRGPSRSGDRCARFGRYLLSLLTNIRARRGLLKVNSLASLIELFREALLLLPLLSTINRSSPSQPGIIHSEEQATQPE
jgi:hypothetical protein